MIPYMTGKLAPNSTHSIKRLVKYVLGRGHFRTVPSQNGDNFFTSAPPPQSMNGSVLASDVEKHHPGSRESVKMHLGLPRDGYRTLGHGGGRTLRCRFWTVR